MLQTSITAWLKKPASGTKTEEKQEPACSIKTEEQQNNPTAEEEQESALETFGNTGNVGGNIENIGNFEDDGTGNVGGNIENIGNFEDDGNNANIGIDRNNANNGNKFALPPLPPNVELVPLTADLMAAYKRLNVLTMPVEFGSAFYAETMTEPIHGITLIATWRAIPSASHSIAIENPRRVVGAIRCRVQPDDQLYISALSLLAPYRSHGIATHLLHRVISKAAREYRVDRVTGHVWEANDEALEWYAKRGFEVSGKIEKYYHKLKPQGALLIEKAIKPSDLLAVADVLTSTSAKG